MSDKPKEIEKMIASVMRARDMNRTQATDYMLGVATGRLLALGRYTDTLPEGKRTKGILDVTSPRKKRAPKSARITTLVAASAAEAEKPAKKKRASKPKKRKAAKKDKADQLEIATAAAE